MPFVAGKLETMKEESSIKMEKSDDCGENHRMDGGKNMNNDMMMKKEIKNEPMDEGMGDSVMKDESMGIKEEPMTPMSSQDSALDIKVR